MRKKEEGETLWHACRVSPSITFVDLRLNLLTLARANNFTLLSSIEALCIISCVCLFYVVDTVFLLAKVRGSLSLCKLFACFSNFVFFAVSFVLLIYLFNSINNYNLKVYPTDLLSN